MLHGVRAGWPSGCWGIWEFYPGQTLVPAAFGKNPEVRQFPSPDCRRLQWRHNQVQIQQKWSRCSFVAERTMGSFMYFSCSSDESDDSDAALGTGLSLDPSTQHTALTVKSEPCEQGDGLAEAKPFNGALLQGKGKMCYHITTRVRHCWCHLTVHGRCGSCTFVSCDISSLQLHRPQSR